MSYDAMTWAIRQDIEPLAKLVLTVIASHHNRRTGQCNPSVETLVRETRLPRRSLMRTLTTLRDLELVSSKRNRRAAATYELRFETSVLEVPELGTSYTDQEVPNPTLRSAKSCIQEVPTRARRREQGIEQGKKDLLASLAGGERDEEARVGKSKSGKGTPLPDHRPAGAGEHHDHRTREPGRNVAEPGKPSVRSILKAVLSEDALRNLLEHRRAIKKPLTIRGAELLAGHLKAAPAGCDLTPDEAVDVMIERGWQGFSSDWVLKARQQRGPPGRQPNGGPPPRRGFFDLLNQLSERPHDEPQPRQLPDGRPAGQRSAKD